MRRAATLLAAALLLAGCATSPKRASPEANRLPDITLPALGTGPKTDLGALRGPAVVNVWASWCVPCKRELPIYGDYARKYAGRVDVLGIDFQEPRRDKAQAMVRIAQVGYPVAYDFEGQVRAFALPELMFVDANGIIVYREYEEITSVGQLEKLVSDHLGVKAS